MRGTFVSRLTSHVSPESSRERECPERRVQNRLARRDPGHFGEPRQHQREENPRLTELKDQQHASHRHDRAERHDEARGIDQDRRPVRLRQAR